MAPYYDNGQCVIYHGDARDVLPVVGVVDLLVTDPPYGISYQSNKSNRHHGNPAIAGDNDTEVAYEVLPLALAHLRHGRHFYVFGPFDLSTLTKGITCELIWDKTRPGMGNLSIPWSVSHERITFGSWTKFKSETGRGGLTARLRRGSVLAVPPDNKGQGARLHPTAKPVRLLRELIESSSLFDETVLDPFMGAGSTLVAAQAEGRKAIGIEIEERYCEIAARRLDQGVLDLGVA